MTEVLYADMAHLGEIIEAQMNGSFEISLHEVDGEKIREMNKSAERSEVQRISQKKLADAQAQRNLLVATAKNALQGYLILKESAKNSWEIDTINVHNDSMKEGVGSALLEKSYEIMRKRGAQNVRLMPDTLAESYWHRQGYKREGRYMVKKL